MAFLTAQGIARVGIALLKRTLALPRTVTMVPAEGFTGPNGETITVRVRQPRSAQEQTVRGASITYSTADEVPVDVTLRHLYDAQKISDEEMSLDLEAFASQVTEVQVAAVATGAEDQIGGVMNALPVDLSFDADMDPNDTKATILAAREALGEADAPTGDRFFAVSPSIASRVLLVPDFVRADASGSTDALRNAVIGRLFGFTFVESNALDPDTAVAYHRSGFCWANKKPAEPKGAVDSSALTEQGISLRQIFDYESRWLSDVSVISTFAGAAAVYEDADESSPADNHRFVKIGVESSSS